MKPTVFVLTANYKEYSEYLTNRQDVNKYNYKYLDNISMVYGIHGGDLILTGDYKLRADLAVIQNYCQMANFEMDFQE